MAWNRCKDPVRGGKPCQVRRGSFATRLVEAPRSKLGHGHLVPSVGPDAERPPWVPAGAAARVREAANATRASSQRNESKLVSIGEGTTLGKGQFVKWVACTKKRDNTRECQSHELTFHHKEIQRGLMTQTRTHHLNIQGNDRVEHGKQDGGS